ncbi:MAG: response regulator transcription factor [Dermatophilus congolensis]|nr:response regulator transcription factor [Dermatophilus congolensis]
MIRIIVVDDQQLLRRGLSLLFETIDDVEMIGEAADGREALAVIAKMSPDVVLTDARMPVMDGVQLVAACAKSHPGLPVLVLTTFDDDELVRDALSAGAAGFLLKDSAPEALAEAIRAAHSGGLVIDPRVARAAFSHSEAPAATGPLTLLTQSERAVAERVAQGESNAEIAAALHLAEGTVRNTVSNLLAKLGQADRTKLALTLYKALRG